MYRLCKAALQTRVCVNEVVHLVGIASHNTDELSTVILQSFQQRVNSLCTKTITVIRLQRIGLVNKQDTTHRRVYQLIRLDSCLAREACNKLAAVGFNKLPSRKDSQGAEDVGHDTGHRRLTCSRITRKDIMLALECIGFSSANLQIEECRQVGDFLLDSGQSHHSVELGKTIGIIDSLGSLIGDVGNVY